MPLGTPALATAQVGATGSTATTASFTPAEGDLLVAFVFARGSSAAEPTISDSISSSWTAVPSSFVDAGFTVGKLFYQTIGASPAARTVTGTSTSGSQTGIAVIKVASGEITTNFATDTDTVGDPSLTLSSFASGSACLGFYVSNAGSATTPPTNHTELYDANVATNLRSSTSYEAATASTTSLSWTGGGSDTIGMGLEIAEAGGAVVLTADAGSYAISGTAATLKTGKIVSAASGSYSISGTAATLRKSLPLVASGGSYAIIGANATLLHLWKVAANAGSYTIAGTDATLIDSGSSPVLAAGSAAYAVSGAAAGLNYSPNAGGAGGWAQIIRRRRT